MKKAFFAFLLAFGGTLAVQAEVNPKPFVVPELTSWQGAEGRFVPSGRIVVPSNKSLRVVAERFAADYATMFGRKLTLVSGDAQAGDFVFSLQKDVAERPLGKEGYVLRIGKTAAVSAADVQGAYWATRTLLQLSEQNRSHTLPCGTTTDIPAYALRGFMIDCGRKFIPMDYLNKLVSVMAYYKMNTLQVHLNDNGFKQYFGNDWNKTQSAFRLESNFFPGLTAKDGSYTKREFIDFQVKAEQQYVDIVPEIDVPAHSLAFSHYRPSLGSKEYGIDHLDLNNPAVVPFLDSLFTEYCGGSNPVFRGKTVHIGTDEYSNKDKAVVEKFRALTDHLIRHVEKHGKQAMVWGALTHAQGETPVKVDNVKMQIWYNGYADPVKMKELGYKLVSIPDGQVYIVPAAGYYYDYLNTQWLYNNWTPATIGSVKFEEGDPSLLGGMFAVWNDHVGNGITVKDIHHRVMPALQTLATKCWTAKQTSLPYADFERQSRFLSEAPGVDELGRTLGKGTRTTADYPNTTLLPSTTLDWIGPEIGYDYSVSFDLEATAVNKGDTLFTSPNATLYLASPESGKLAFVREGCLNEFDYAVPKGKRVRLTLQGNRHETRLLVNGRFHQALYPLTLGAVSPNAGAAGATSDPYSAAKMYYQRTLVFPLQRTGAFHGKIMNLSVSNFIE